MIGSEVAAGSRLRPETDSSSDAEGRGRAPTTCKLARTRGPMNKLVDGSHLHQPEQRPDVLDSAWALRVLRASHDVWESGRG